MIHKILARKTTMIKKRVDSPLVHIDSVVYFGSGSKFPYHRLSNFNKCSIMMKNYVLVGVDDYVLKEFVFPSSEHAWWSFFLSDEKDIERLAVNGDLSTLDGLKYFYKGEELKKKIEYWSKKDNVGIVAKLLAGREGTNYRRRAVKLGMKMSVHPCHMYGPVGNDATLAKIWARILVCKYSQNEKHRAILLSTAEKTLVEFTRAPVTRIGKEFWAGRVVDGRLCGKNYMGECLMSVRNVMLQGHT